MGLSCFDFVLTALILDYFAEQMLLKSILSENDLTQIVEQALTEVQPNKNKFLFNEVEKT